MQKKDTQEQETQEITQLKKRVDTLEEQQKEMLAALEEAAKNQETAKAQAKTDAKDNATKEDAADSERYFPIRTIRFFAISHYTAAAEIQNHS